MAAGVGASPAGGGGGGGGGVLVTLYIMYEMSLGDRGTALAVALAVISDAQTRQKSWAEFLRTLNKRLRLPLPPPHYYYSSIKYTPYLIPQTWYSIQHLSYILS